MSLLPMTPAVRMLSTVLGIDIPSRVKECVNPFLLAITDAVPVTPVAGVVDMDCDTRHVSVARHATDAITVNLPPVDDECAAGRVYVVTITSEEGDDGDVYIKPASTSPNFALSDGVYLFANINGMVWGFQNDYETWSSMIGLFQTVIGEWEFYDTSIAEAFEGLQDTATITLSGVTAGDEITIDGVTLTAVASDPGDGEFLVGGNDAATADNLSGVLQDAFGWDSITAENAVITVAPPYLSRLMTITADASMTIAAASTTTFAGALRTLNAGGA